MHDFLVSWIANIPAAAVPYALAALGMIISERAGVLTLTAEGIMLIGALAGIGAFLSLGGSPAIAMALAIASAILISSIFAFLVIALRVNQVIAGLAIVFFAQGLTGLIGTLAGWTNRAVPGIPKFALWPLSELPIAGALFRQDLVVFATPLIVALIWFWLFRTGFGLRMRAVGENPEAADASGISVWLYRTIAVLSGAALMGLAGAYISLVSSKIWIAGMTGGRGWIAVALVVFARWRPWPALGGAVLFGAVETLVPRTAAIGLQLPQYYVLMSPYLITIAIMIWVGLKSRSQTGAPMALGEPFVREERR